jgi:hypothetical protein
VEDRGGRRTRRVAGGGRPKRTSAREALNCVHCGRRDFVALPGCFGSCAQTDRASLRNGPVAAAERLRFASLVLGDLKTDIRDHVYQHSPVVGRILSLSCIIASTDSSVHVNDSAVPRLSALRACASSAYLCQLTGVSVSFTDK